MGFPLRFPYPWNQTTPSSDTPSSVPQEFSVSIGGRPYVVNTSFEPYRRDAFRHRTIQPQRESIDLTNIPGEGTVNTEGLWRREAIDWSYGAGQPWQDRKGSADNRFSTSKGVNPWMQWQLSLLPDTQQLLASSGTTQAIQCGKYLYVLDTTAQTLKFSPDLVTWTSVTFTSPPYSPVFVNMATDGFDLWIADASNGAGTAVWQTTAGATTATGLVTGGYSSGVWWVGDRLMSAAGNIIFNITSTSPAPYPTPLFTHPDSNWAVTAMADGSSQIYIAGYDKGQGMPLNAAVYRTTIESTGTALTVPVQALPLEGGEYAVSLYGYLNYIFVGTNLGVRMCRTLAAYDPTGNQGDLEAGPLIPGLFPPGPVNAPVRGLTANNRFLYFGWSNYDAASTGIGRMDLSTFIDTQAPAFTSDLMVTGQGEIVNLTWCNINNQPVICVKGLGVYTASSVNVDSGYVDSGLISYGIADDKIVMAGDIGTLEPQFGPVSMSLSSNGSALALVGTQQDSDDGGTSNQSAFAINQIRGETYTVRMTLYRDAGNNKSPVLHRWTLKAIPAITAGTTISVVLLLYGTTDNRGSEEYRDPYAEYAYLESLRTTQSVVEYVEGPYSAMVTIEEIDWLPFKERDADPEGGYIGDCIVYLKTFDIGA